MPGNMSKSLILYPVCVCVCVLRCSPIPGALAGLERRKRDGDIRHQLEIMPPGGYPPGGYPLGGYLLEATFQEGTLLEVTLLEVTLLECTYPPGRYPPGGELQNSSPISPCTT